MENVYDRRERTIYVSGMHQTVTEEHLYELFTKASRQFPRPTGSQHLDS
jgi:hypothetical protein